RELLLDDALRQHEPRIVVAGAHDVLELAERVGARKKRRGQARARRVEPHRRGPWQDADAVARPDWIPVPDALDIMPHPVAVDQPRACRFGDADHAAVDVFGHAGDHALWRLAQSFGPVLPDQIVIAADAAGGDDHRLRAQRKIADDFPRTALAALDRVRLEDRSADADHGAIGHEQPVDTMAETKIEPAAGLRLARATFERFDHAGAGAPTDVKSRHRIAVAHRVIAAALGPADHRENTVSHRAQPAAFLACRESHIGFRPAPRPQILVAVEAGRAHPVLQCEIKTVLDAEPALFRGVDQKQSAERPKRLATKALFAFLLDDEDAFAGVRDFGRGDQPRQPATDHDHVRIVGHRLCTPQALRE